MAGRLLVENRGELAGRIAIRAAQAFQPCEIAPRLGERALFGKRRAFAVALPDKYIRLQRREFFRLVLPMTRRPPCRVKLGPQEQEFMFSVIDIGIGGVGLESPATSLPLAIGETMKGALIDLKGATVMRLDLEVRYLGQLARGSRQVGHVGCRFASLSAAQEHEIQKFITQVQREERAKLG